MENCKTITALMTFESPNPDELERYLDHHIEYIMDLDNNTDVISSVHGVMSYNPEDKHDRTKIQMLATILSDILANEPSDADLDYDDDNISLYDELHNLKNCFEQLGIL